MEGLNDRLVTPLPSGSPDCPTSPVVYVADP